MKKVVYILLPIITSCYNTNTKEIAVVFENNSDVDSIINVKTYVDNQFYRTIQVKRDTTIVRYDTLLVKYPNKKEQVNLKFILEKSKDTTNCILQKGRLNTKSYVHVNFNEVLFKKGFDYVGHVLQNDSIVRRDFYCEIIN